MQKHIKSVVVSVLAFLAITLALTACLPEGAYVDYNNDGTIDANERKWKEWEVASSIKKANANRHSSTDCYGEMRRHFPAHAHAAMSDIIHRESRGNAGAKSSISSASGCFQMMASLHGGRLPPGGSFFNAHDNTVAALSLWREEGVKPWRFSL